MNQSALSRSTLLSCSLSDDGVYMRFPNGKVIRVENSLIDRSEMLADYLASAGGDEFTIPVFEDLFDAWLSLVDVLERGDDVQNLICGMKQDEVLLYLQVRKG
jgi:hypothetical protein